MGGLGWPEIHGVTGHSLRAGSVVELVLRGASLGGIQQAGRWQSPTHAGAKLERRRSPVARSCGSGTGRRANSSGDDH